VSLLVNVYLRDGQDGMQFLDGPQGSDLAGGEQLRTSLYGSAYVIGLGARLLPLLDGDDLYVETPDELDLLNRDCALILADLPQVAAATGLEPDYVAHRVGNIRAAAVRARQLGACVVVW
jgi:hypothetical protein